MPRTAPELAANLTVGLGGVTLKNPLICGAPLRGASGLPIG